MKKSLIKDESAQVGTIFEVGIVIFIVALAKIALGYAVELYVTTISDMDLIMSQYRLDSITMLLKAFDIFIILAGLVLVVYVIKRAADRRAQQVI